MTRDTLIPEAQLASVVTALYEDAHAKNWSHLPPRDRSRAYSAWVDDARIGGILTSYMAPEAARAWIKDGPMKEYGRALRGTGRYARFGKSGGTTAKDIIRAALGDGWTLVEGTDGIKPFHAQASDQSGAQAYLAWDLARNFRNLIWAALRASVELGVPGHVVVTEPPGTATAREVIDGHTAIARRCGLSIHYVREQLGSTR
jgi:hypothetical protein